MEDNKKLPKHLQVKIPKKSDNLVPKRWEGAAIGALQEAAEAYIVGELGFFFKKIKEMLEYCFEEILHRSKV